MDNFKLKLKNVLHSTQYCGICLENEDNMSTTDEDLEIIVNQQRRTKALKAILSVVFNKAENILASSFLCSSCTEKLTQSYIFIESAKESHKMLDSYINDLSNKSEDVFKHLPDSSVESTNVVIVLENNLQETAQKQVIKEPNNIEKEYQSINKSSEFKCLKCCSTLPSFSSLKLHQLKCKKLTVLQCRICFKTFRNKTYLSAHYKVHSKVKCKFCCIVLNKHELLDHLETNHGDSLHKCSKCKVAYPLRILQKHIKKCNRTDQDKSQCLMCLEYFTTEELRDHSCKFGCPECFVTPCVHHKYLAHYREQILNKVGRTRCLDCDFVGRNKEILLGHINQQHLDHHPFTCDICQQQYYTKNVLTAHILKFHKDCFVCQFCDTKFSNINNYEEHVKGCEDIRRKFACEHCPASFDFLDHLKNHITHKHTTDIFPCGFCNKKFSNASNRKEHMLKVHSGLKVNNEDINVECVVCQKKFDTKRDLVHHMKSHGTNTPYSCKICSSEYETLRQLRAHSRKHKGPFTTCHICGKEMREVLLKNHLNTHTDSVETCEVCGRSFQNISLLKYHQKVHLECVPCPKCKKMINPARLRRHWKIHLAEEDPDKSTIKKQQPNLKCEQCDYKTWNNTLLECHVNRHHLKIKPYVCHICSKDFIGKHLLKKHIETHYMKSVMCMVCLKSFANSTCLKMHLRLHTGEKPFTCEICGDRFRSSSIMNVHKLKKHSDRSNVCPLCSNKFHTVRDLRRHVIKVHWKEKGKRFDPRELKGLDKEHYHLFHDGRRVKVAEEDVDLYMPC